MKVFELSYGRTGKREILLAESEAAAYAQAEARVTGSNREYEIRELPITVEQFYELLELLDGR
jgi:hypothetical protein